jgi:hypothetical protein
MFEWGGHHGGWGGFGPPSYIVKKCPALIPISPNIINIPSVPVAMVLNKYLKPENVYKRIMNKPVLTNIFKRN